MTVTEIAVIPLKAGFDLDTPGSEGHGVVQDILRTLQDQPGLQDIFHGRPLERPDMWTLAINWDAVSSHHAFMQSRVYGPFMQRVSVLSSSGAAVPSPYHVSFADAKSFARLAAYAPLVELLTLYFEPGVDAGGWERKWSDFANTLCENADGNHGAAAGWVLEELPHEGVPGGKARVFVAAIGWESREAHEKYRETEPFKRTVGLLRGESKAASGYHIKFHKV